MLRISAGSSGVTLGTQGRLPEGSAGDTVRRAGGPSREACTHAMAADQDGSPPRHGRAVRRLDSHGRGVSAHPWCNRSFLKELAAGVSATAGLTWRRAGSPGTVSVGDQRMAPVDRHPSSSHPPGGGGGGYCQAFGTTGTAGSLNFHFDGPRIPLE